MASKLSFPLLLLVGVILLAKPANAFGAGNIASVSKIEGSNWRHGDIEDALLTIASLGGHKFSKMDVKRTYFGNWLRDYSQAVDVGTVKYVSAEAIRLLLWVLGFMSFGYGTGEFEVTRDRLGCYRPEEHIDNPKDYADNIDARQYDRRLRGPVDEPRELNIDTRTGLKHYIATEDIGITTSAGMVKNLYAKCIQLGRRYNQNGDKRDFYEALRLLGTANHCLEDYSAHSNYTELALIELGERNVFPHVGRRTQMQLQGARGPVYPLVTGTFGGVDFLHSVMGELSDKATQSEMQDLEGTIAQSKKQDTSLLKNLLNQIPSGILGGDDHAGKADQLQANAQSQQMANMHISPKEPEAFTRQVDELSKQIYPILEFHDNIIQKISEAIDKIPILPDLLEQLQEQVNIFVFSLLAPYVMPIIKQVKTELSTGSSEVIKSSQEKQLIVFHDDNSTDPTHSMLSKDHFSNVLNEPAGKIASNVVKWVVPQIVACWDDPNVDIARTVNRICNGVFHHPALNQYGEDGAQDGRRAMFGTVANWWQSLDEREKNELRNKLSREGVQSGRNHKEGVKDNGHGCGKPLGMPSMKTSQSSGALGGIGSLAALGSIGSMLGSGSGGGHYGGSSSGIGSMASSAVGGGAMGSLVGGLVENAVGGDLLGSNFDDDNANKKEFKKKQHGRDGSVTEQVIQTGHHPGQHPQYGQQEHGAHPVPQYGQQQHGGQQYGQQHGQQHGDQERYGQASMSQTQYPGGGYRQEYQRYEQDGPGGQTGYGFQQSQEVRPMHGGGYEQRVERRFEHPGGRYEQEVQEQRVSPHGRVESREEKKHGYKKKDSDDSDSDDRSDDDDDKKAKKQRKRAEKEMKKQREQEQKQFRRQSGSPKRERRHSGAGSPQHGRQHSGGGGGGGGGFGGFLGDMLGGGGGGGGMFGGGGGGPGHPGGPGHRGGRGGGGPGQHPGRGGGHGGGRGRGSRDIESSEYGGSADNYQQEMRSARPQYDEDEQGAYGQQSHGGSSYEQLSYGGDYERRDDQYGGLQQPGYGSSDYGRPDYGGGYEQQQQQQSYGSGDYGGQEYGEQQSYQPTNYEQQYYGGQQSYGGQNERYDRDDSYGRGGDSGYGPPQGEYDDDRYERRRW